MAPVKGVLTEQHGKKNHTSRPHIRACAIISLLDVLQDLRGCRNNQSICIILNS